MSLFSDLMQDAGVPLLLEASGKPFTLLGPGGETLSVTGLISEERQVVRQTSRGREIVRGRHFSFSQSAAAPFGGSARAEEGWKVVMQDEAGGKSQYDVFEIQSRADGMTTVLAQRVGITQLQRPGAMVSGT